MADTTADTATTDTDAEAATADASTQDTTTDLASEVEKWKAQARKHEQRAKDNANAAKQLTELQQQSMTDTERAVAEARTTATDEARKVFGRRLVAAEVKAAAAGRDVDVAALAEGIDPLRFLTDDGDPDVDAIAAWVDRVAPVKEQQQSAPATVTFGQGVRQDNASMALNGDPLLQSLKQKLNIN